MRTGALVVVMLAVGCGSQSALDYGREIFDSTSISSAASNPFKCSTCHEVTATPTKQLPGYVLYDSVVRASWWGGNVLTLLDATNQCIYNFMRGNVITDSDEKGRRAVRVPVEHLARRLGAAVPADGGREHRRRAERRRGHAGRSIWNQSCANCHGAPHTGQGRLSDQVSNQCPDDSIAAHGTSATMGARPVVIEKVRHGKFFNVGGNMPLFSLEAMSDAQLGDVLAYLETFGLPPSQ